MKAKSLFVALLLALCPFSIADEPKKVEPKKAAEPGLVPFQLTNTHHTLVRIKINGKGPFNFVVDTGCPVLLIAEPVGAKIGLKSEKGWATLDKLELEGGLELTKVKARVETPFQIKGMNAMGLPGVELHGLMGYTVLAKYKMQFDYTKRQMAWTPLAFEPAPPMPLGGKGGGTPGGMDFMVELLSTLAAFAGIGPAPPPQPRGFFGFELEQQDKDVVVTRVLADGPAAKAGVKKGDRIVNIGKKEITDVASVLEQASKLTAGKTLTLTIQRKDEKQELKITAGDGL